MTEQNNSCRLGRKTHLAQALALALALGGGVATTTAVASPGSMGQTQHISAAELQGQQALATIQAQRSADAARATAQTTGVPHYVTNCNDTGGGSLRDTIAHADSGDTIDMTEMSCDTINLNSRILVDQKDLTLVGKVGNYQNLFYFPGTYIHAGSNYRGFIHTGTGTLTLQSIDLSDGEITDKGDGACIYSDGNVQLEGSSVHDCVANKSAGSSYDVKGGAIYAAGHVNLIGSNAFFGVSSWVHDNVASATDGDAYGGGIYAGSFVKIGESSYVEDNVAESVNANANGGGIYSKYYVLLSEPSSYVRDNEAKTHAISTRIKGAGIYAEQFATIFGSVTGNEATSNTSVPVYSTRGGGVYAETGVTATGANISDNHGHVMNGGGIFTNGYLSLQKSTVADNSSRTDAGAIWAKGNVTIIESTISGNTSASSANIRIGAAATNDILIRSSTISNNIIAYSSTSGAALNLQHDATIENSTITGNVGKNDTDTKYGAGISLDSNVNVELSSTIVAGNRLDKGDNKNWFSDVAEAKNASGASITGDHNLITWPGISPIPSDTITGYLPNLGPLADNGGPTETHEPCKNSIRVINNGADNGHGFDQRGTGFPRWVGLSADIGAVEAPSYIDDVLFRNGFEKGACGS